MPLRKNITEFLSMETHEWDLDHLKHALQNAIELEHSTLPLYMFAMYSIKIQNYTAYNLIRSIVMEEMIHMALAANMLSALGGGCRAPIAALGTVTGTALKLEGMVADASGKKILHGSEKGRAISPEELGVKLAQKLLAMGAAEFIAEARER